MLGAAHTRVKAARKHLDNRERVRSTELQTPRASRFCLVHG